MNPSNMSSYVINDNQVTDIVSDELLEIFHTVNFASLATIIATFGIISNILNIIVFVKQGYGDTVNVTLLALAISDLCSLITLQWVNMLRNPFFTKEVPFIPDEVQHLSAAWPHAFFAKTTSWITAYITFERCLCVVLPLKVKNIVTTKLAICVTVAIFTIMLLTMIPEYATSYLDWKFVGVYNKTMLGLKFRSQYEELAPISFTLSGVATISSFWAVIFFTAILVVKMRQKTKWRQSTGQSGQGMSNESLNRDNRTVKMVILIAFICCTCFLPMMVTFAVAGIVPDFSVSGRYRNAFLAAWSFAFLIESVNSSIDVFVYYRMSSKYRRTMDSLLKCSQTN